MGLRLLWSSNAPWCHTGYGIQAKYVIPRLCDLGVEVGVFAWYGLEGATFSISLDGHRVPVYPRLADPLGRDVALAHCNHFRADLMLTVMDIWPLPVDFQEHIGRPWAPWFPLDHAPAPECVVEPAKRAAYPLVYSRWGVDVMAEAGVKVRYLPMGVDCEAFSPGDKVAARKALSLPEDAFIVDMVAANKAYPSRKAFSQCLTAFAEFRKRHSDAVIYLHTEMDQSRGGLDMRGLLSALGLPNEAVHYVDQYSYNCLGLDDGYMANVYRAADVHLGASTSEGFGIPILEAQACGTPVITTAYSSMPEITWSGIAVKPEQYDFDMLGSWIATVPVHGVVEALEEVYGWDDERRLVEAKIARGSALGFDWPVLAQDYWAPLVEEWTEKHAQPEEAP